MNQPQTKPTQAKRSSTDDFITWLYTLADTENSENSATQKQRTSNKHATLAALRRGLGQPPGSTLEMHRYIVAWSQWERSDWGKDSYYLIASLFAFHPHYTSLPQNEEEKKLMPLNMGNHFVGLCEESALDPSPATERRFNALLASPPEDLYRTLQQAISLLKSKNIPINWHQLFKDVKRWDDAENRLKIQRHWASTFWGEFANRQAAVRKNSEANNSVVVVQP